jgi:hypothetical protein
MIDRGGKEVKKISKVDKRGERVICRVLRVSFSFIKCEGPISFNHLIRADNGAGPHLAKKPR